MSKTEYRTLSAKVRRLMAKPEDTEVEFKESLSSLSNEDLVAFANSPLGGSILVGVRESQNSFGRQFGQIVGCKVSDQGRLSILSKAESCVPPVELDIVVENTSRKPFYRVDIPSGTDKPYCTSGARYKIRGNGLNKPLLPSRLLAMFMESEAEDFFVKFRRATENLERELSEIKSRVLVQVNELLDGLTMLDSKLDHTFNIASNTESLADDAMMLSGEAQGYSEESSELLNQIKNKRLPDIEKKIDAVLEHFQIEDPVIAQERNLVQLKIASLYEEGYRDMELIYRLQFPGFSYSELKDLYKKYLDKRETHEKK